MTLLVLLGLLAVAAMYAVFFLLFKLLWVILKKDSNKWPLIWAGISTVLFGIVLSALAAWGIYKVISPFSGMMDRFSENPAPVYGERVYTDPVYRFQLDVFDGMDFSEWMEFDDVDIKLGLDTNFLKDNQSQEEKEANDQKTIAALLIRQSDVDEGHPLQDLRQGLASAANRRRDVEISSQEDLTIDGYPAMFVAGKVFTNQGVVLPFWLTAVADSYQQVFYVVTFALQENPTAEAYALQTARSLQLENGSALPGTTDSSALPAEPQPAAASL